jgi:asparagine synthase (glutamine-hydrolysing)
MSGIFGLFNQDDLSVTGGEFGQMARLMTRRGPDRTGTWNEDSIGMGHTLLASTPEAFQERLPLVNPESGCVITADARIDNRPELLETLGLSHRSTSVGDAGLILAAYLTWGLDCVEHLLGDFAFAIWDPREHRLLCARDHLGIRPLYYHYKADHFFAFASEPRAVLALPQVPYHLNEERIADFLISQLEGIDKTSTFFADVYRLPPAHILLVTPEGMRKHCYWTLKPGPELKLSSNDEYAKAFLEVFSEAVRCRLRGTDTVGSMLSGGMDSGSIAAVAREIMAEEGQVLATFSAISPNTTTCVETQAIHAALSMDGLESYVVSHGLTDDFQSKLQEIVWGVDEPFDSHMTLVHAVYLKAHQQGVKALMDGIDGDTVLSEGSHIVRLLRQGRWPTAYREAVAQNSFWEGAYPVWRELYRCSRRAFLPHIVKQLYRTFQPIESRYRLKENIQESIICPDFARRVNLVDRLQALAAHSPSKMLSTLGEERALAIDHPYLTVGVERYNRVASAVAVEPRHPFLDRRVLTFCLALPGSQKLDSGWPKVILRRAMAGRLPDEVRWRQGKQDLGWEFTQALMETRRSQTKLDIDRNTDLLLNYVDMNKLRKICQSYFDDKDLTQCEFIYETASLAVWLRQHANRQNIVPD